MESITQIETDVLKVLSKYNIDGYELRTIKEKILRHFVDSKIKEFNVFNVKNHIIEGRNSGNNEQYKSVYNEDLSFNEIEANIKELFKDYTAEDRIKEIIPSIQEEKILGNGKRYFSSWDFQKLYDGDNVKIKEAIKKAINPLKEYCFYTWGLKDNYYKAERLRDLNEFLNLAYEVGLKNKDWNYFYGCKIQEFQDEINENSEVNLRIFNNWFYLSFTHEGKQDDLKNRVINGLYKRLKKED